MDGYIILVGMMGAGKSTVGKILAENLNLPFVDSDTLIERRLGRKIDSFFKNYGEEAFREHEHNTFAELEPEPGVLSTGGGVVLREDNWEQLKRLGTVVYLSASPETLIARLEASKRKRPLLEREDWKDHLRTILDQRTRLYEQADIHISVDNVDLRTAAELIEFQLGEE